MAETNNIPIKSLTISATLAVTVLMSLGTTIFNLYDKSSEQKISELHREIEDLKQQNSILHRRISENSNTINTLQVNLAGYNAILSIVQTDVSEIKRDIKEIIRSNKRD